MTPDSIEKIADDLMEAAKLLASFRIFTCSREKAKQPEGTDLFDEQIERLRETAARVRALPSAELERDAARYRYIRSGECHIHSIWFQSFGERFNLTESDLDGSVDAAIVRAKGAPR